MHFCNTASAFVLFKAITEASKVKNGHYHGSNCCGKAREGRVDNLSASLEIQTRLLPATVIFFYHHLPVCAGIPSSVVLCPASYHQRENRGPTQCFKLPRAATLDVQAGGSTGNADRQQRDSKLRAEGKAMMCIKTGRNNKS